MIPFNDFVPLASLTMGKETRHNHLKCSAGEDTKKRLYVKRVSDGILAYCHHCGQSGCFIEGPNLRKWIDTVGKIEEERVVEGSTRKQLTKELHDSASNIFSTAAISWLALYNVASYYCGGADKEGNILLPIFDHNSRGDVIGLQTRNVQPGMPKYTTKYASDWAHSGSGSWFTQESDTLVVTEDILSAIKVAKTTRMDTLALLRTSISAHDTSIAISKYKKIIVWLDDDDAGRHGTETIVRRLSFIASAGVHITNVTGVSEPKKCTTTVIKETLSC